MNDNDVEKNKAKAKEVLDKETANLEKAKTAAENLKKRSDEMLNKAEEKLSAATANTNGAKAECAQFSQACVEAEKAIKQTQSKIGARINKLTYIWGQEENLRSEYAGCQASIAAYRNQAARATDKQTAQMFEAQIAGIEARMAQIQKALAQYARTEKKLTDEIVSLQKKVDDLCNKLQDLKGKLEAAEAKLKDCIAEEEKATKARDEAQALKETNYQKADQLVAEAEAAYNKALDDYNSFNSLMTSAANSLNDYCRSL